MTPGDREHSLMGLEEEWVEGLESHFSPFFGFYVHPYPLPSHTWHVPLYTCATFPGFVPSPTLSPEKRGLCHLLALVHMDPTPSKSTKDYAHSRSSRGLADPV
jgi:hypothetical protein